MAKAPSLFTDSNHADTRVRLSIIIAGLILWFVSYALKETHWLGINLGEAGAHLGFLIAVITTLHWIYDARIRNNLVNDIMKLSLGSVKLAESGIINYIRDAKKIDHDDDLRNSNSLTVCVHYHPRFIEDNFELLLTRSNKKHSTIVIALKENGASLQYLLDAKHESGHIIPNMRKIRALVVDLKQRGVKIELIEHDSILRYSFVQFDETVWVKFYKNALGWADVPAIEVRRGTDLFNFFDKDIQSMKAGNLDD
jgi:hypothetical protein